jgi:hypothetical protein
MAVLPAVLRRLRRSTPADPKLHGIKKRVIDVAFERSETRSFADLGGVWAVDAGYTFYALERFKPSRAVLVDEEITAEVRSRATHHPELELREENFGAADVAAQVGEVDCIFLFDVLLHQVAPDWDELLRLYAPLTRAFLVVNPQFTIGEHTVRLVDLGRERYLQLVPDLPRHREVWEQIDAFDESRGRPHRDVHEIWQWGIVDADLRARMDELGFELVHFENGGRWGDLPAFENHAFVFTRS